MESSVENLVAQLALADIGVPIESWSVLGSGQNSVAVLINDEWVFRFPRHAAAAESLDEEVAILQAVHGRLPVLTPDPEIAVDVPGIEWPVVAYRMIVGQVLDAGQIELLTAIELNRLGRDLGRFMNTLQGTPRSQISAKNLRSRDNQQQWDRLKDDTRQYLKPRVVSAIWNKLNRKLNKSIDKIGMLEIDPVLRHGDFGFGNFLFDRHSHLVGVIDFGSAGFGDPAVDVAGLISVNGPGDSMIDRVRPAYPAVDDLVERARIYRETFALEHALLGAKGSDEVAVAEGLDAYLGG